MPRTKTSTRSCPSLCPFLGRQVPPPGPHIVPHPHIYPPPFWYICTCLYNVQLSASFCVFLYHNFCIDLQIYPPPFLSPCALFSATAWHQGTSLRPVLFGPRLSIVLGFGIVIFRIVGLGIVIGRCGVFHWSPIDHPDSGGGGRLTSAASVILLNIFDWKRVNTQWISRQLTHKSTTENPQKGLTSFGQLPVR